jgi:ATP-dependent DNA ligase
MNSTSLPTLFSRTSTGAVQEWRIETAENRFRVTSGQVDGKKVVNEWTTCIGMNVGRANETSPNEQAQLEALSKWEKKKKTGYTTCIDLVDKCITYVEPMLAKKYGDVEFSFPIYSQPKLDGMRCICRADGMWSRTGKKIVSAPHIHEALKHLFDNDPELIFDGELFCSKYKNDFNAIISLAKQTKPSKEDLAKSEASLEYWIYDFPSSTSNFGKRFDELKAILPKHKAIVLVDTFLAKNQEELDAKYAEYLTDGQEGQIIRFDAAYENKRSRFLLKRKTFVDAEFKILDITEGKGNRSGMFGRAECITDAGVKFEANARGNAKFYTDLFVNRKKYIGEKATVRYQNMTPDGKPRFGVIVAIRNYE